MERLADAVKYKTRAIMEHLKSKFNNALYLRKVLNIQAHLLLLQLYRIFKTLKHVSL